MHCSPYDIQATKYIIYVRKSTDDPQKQVRSTDDQIKECNELAERLKLNVIGKPIVEEISAKKPDKRPKFNDLLKWIEKGVINGIISWHPDRLARNMTEGGRLIQLVDDGKLLDIKFVSFPFTNDANGKMMLGIQFALSKHYSDKLSTDIMRGLINNLQEGKSAGHYKPGYFRDPESGYYHPDTKNFDIVKKAWEMKLNNYTETAIVEKLNNLGYKRILKQKKIRQKREQSITKNKLNKIFSDPIYYGILEQGGAQVDLRELYDFETMITEEDFMQVKKTKKNYQKEAVKHPFPFRGFVVCNQCQNYRIAGAGQGKFKSNKYLYYRCDTEGCPEKGKSIRAKEIISAINSVLKDGFSVAKIDKVKLREAVKISVAKNMENIDLETKGLRLQLASLKRELGDLVENYLRYGNSYDDIEKNEYRKQKSGKETIIKQREERLAELTKIKSESMPDIENTLNSLKMASESFLNGDHNTKDKIAKIIFLNSYTEKGKVLYLSPKKPFDKLINHPLVLNGGDEGA